MKTKTNVKAGESLEFKLKEVIISST